MSLRTILLAGIGAAALGACGGDTGGETASDAAQAVETAAEDAVDAVEDAGEAAAEAVEDVTDRARLAAILAAQPDEVKARYDARHPGDTIAFFDIEPGETVVEALPGGGWYTKILLAYLGPEGRVIGSDYSIDMWPLFGGFATDEFVEEKKTWVTDWTAEAAGWGVENAASIGAYQMGAMPADLEGTVDTVIFVRALHNLARFESDGGFLSSAISETFRALKPGGIVGVVQHRAPEASPDEWADGSNGYLKTSFVVSAFEAAGFELVDSSEINANPKDQPTTEDFVWRLSPTLGTSGENAELRAEMEAIGESDRMTLKFRKPS